MLFLLLGSCARMLNRSSVLVPIETPGDEVVAVNGRIISDPAIQEKNLASRYRSPGLTRALARKLYEDDRMVFAQVPRSKEPLEIKISGGGRDTTVLLSPKYDENYTANFLTLGIGYLVDIGTPKKYVYKSIFFTPRHRIYEWEGYELAEHRAIAKIDDLRAPKGETVGVLRMSGAAKVRRRTATRQTIREKLDNAAGKGKFYLTVGLPYVNYIAFTPPLLDRRDREAGFWGLSAGAEYNYSDRFSVALEINYLLTFFLPVPAPVDTEYGPEDEWLFLNQGNISLTNNVNFRRFALGAGLNFSYNDWRYNYQYDDVFFEENPDYENNFVSKYGLYRNVRDRYWAAGLNLNAYFKAAACFRVGVVYRPTFIRFGRGNKYENSVSLDLKFLINTGKPLRNL